MIETQRQNNTHIDRMRHTKTKMINTKAKMIQTYRQDDTNTTRNITHTTIG
jgi:hypothetical protein